MTFGYGGLLRVSKFDNIILIVGLLLLPHILSNASISGEGGRFDISNSDNNFFKNIAYAESFPTNTKSTSDNSRPSVAITIPSARAIVQPGTVTVEGNASDPGSGIAKVEAFAHSLPFDDKYPFQAASVQPIGNDLYKWHISLNINSTEPHRILVRATDNSGNENWADVVINVSTNSAEADRTPPTVNITSPRYCTCSINGAKGSVALAGVANDSGSGIAKVETFVEKMPFGKTFPFQLATPKSSNDWSTWSIRLDSPSPSSNDTTSPQRILVRVTDKAGNENWDEEIINFLSPLSDNSILNTTHLSFSSSITQDQDSKVERIAFIDPTFTTAAYSAGGFYTFYPKYVNTSRDVNITSDLDFLTTKVPSYVYGSDFAPLIEHVHKALPNSPISVLGDGDVHLGRIFNKNNNVEGNDSNQTDNAYDVIFLLHNEYVTQQEYHNLKQFVQNGGTIVFLDGNIFYGEVKFDASTCTITLLKGHGWEFNGKSAWRSVHERWANETTEWVGSNFIYNSLTDPVTFSNNPFNYTHFEENYVTSPRAKILMDYGFTVGPNYSSDPNDRFHKVATYEMTYGKGKVIMLGIYSTNLQDNAAFLDFFDRTILPHAGVGID
jgi:hypothetical protein